MERENQRIVITKRMLKESMLKILQEKELDAINVTELCREAGINRTTFYRHYQIPRDVLTEIHQDLYRELRQRVDMPKSIEDIHPVTEKLCVFLNEHRELLRIFIRSNSDTDFVNFMNEIYRELAWEYSHIPVLKKLNQEDIRLLTLYNTGGSYFVFRSWIMGSIKKTPKEMADYVYGVLEKTKDLMIAALPVSKNE